MNKSMLTVLLFSGIMLYSQTSTAQVKKGEPIANTPVLDVKHVPKAVLKEFESATSFGLLLVSNKPVWTRQNGLYSVSFRGDSEWGPGAGQMRFKPYGGLVLFNFVPDNPVNEPWND